MGKQWKQWHNLFSWPPKSLQIVTAAAKLKDTCSWEENYCKPRQYIKKQRHTLPTKIRTLKAMVFPVVMYGYECWTIKKAECWRTDALNCDVGKVSWESPCSARISCQSILKEINLQYSFSSLQRSCSVCSNSLQPHGMQHTRLPYPPPTPGACSNSCPWSQWCNPTISSSVIPSLLLPPSIFP